MHIRLDYSNTEGFIDGDALKNCRAEYREVRKKIIEKTGAGSDFLGWVHLPEHMGGQLLEDIIETARMIREESDIFITIGIGGSYLGARAAIEALSSTFYNQAKKPLILFAGNSISPRYMKDLMELIEGKQVFVNVISKSGTTTEPALAFRLIRRWMIDRYGRDEANRRTVATTDGKKGALLTLAREENIKTFTIPDDVGGRFSVLSPVGLLPIAAAGIDIRELLKGARSGALLYREIESLEDNPASMYAVIRSLLYKKDKTTEILANFEPQLHFVSEWWKQLFGESEGKDHKGIFPASCDFTADLHSMGQWIQDGRRSIFETFIHIDDTETPIACGEDPQNLDNLNYLAHSSFQHINTQALLGTRQAHFDGGVPNMTIHMPRLSPFNLGQLFYFFMWAVAVSGYMLEVNPFDQPGVESYKKNMFALLGKPGSEEETKKLKKILEQRKTMVSQSSSALAGNHHR